MTARKPSVAPMADKVLAYLAARADVWCFTDDIRGAVDTSASVRSIAAACNSLATDGKIERSGGGVLWRATPAGREAARRARG